MKSQLTFSSHGVLYAIEAEFVLEVVELPALSPWPAAPMGVVGVVNYRGEILPVIDIARRMGEAPAVPTDKDDLIVVETSRGRAALLVTEALELVSDLALNPVSDDPPASLRSVTPMLRGLGSYKERVVLGLDLEQVLDFPLNPDPQLDVPSQPSSELMRQRAVELSAPLLPAEPEQGRSFVLVSLCGELLGIAVEEVAELGPCPPLVPVPGAPPHLLGLAYHRGRLLRLVDIRKRCGLETSGPLPGSVVILTGPGMSTGMLVDSFEAVTTLLGSGPKLFYQDRWVTVLDTRSLDVRERRDEQDLP